MANLFQRLRNAGSPPLAQSTKSSKAGAILALHALGQARWTPRTNVALTQAGYERNAIVHRAVRMIAESVATVPWRLFEGRTEIVTHPLLSLVNRPNPAETSTSFLEGLVSNLLLFGNAYIELAAIDGVPRELYNLRADRMTIIPGRNGWPSAFEYNVGSSRVRYDMSVDGLQPVLHLKLYHPLDDHYGLSPLAAAQVALDTHNAAGYWNKALLDNAARPSGALVYAGPDGAHLSEDQFTRLKQELDDNFSGAANAGRPLLLEGGLDWKALSLSPKDMDFIQTKAAAAREIALAFGVPPLVLGLPGDNTFSNYQEANRAFWRQTVIPNLIRVQKAFSAWFAPAYGTLTFDYDVDRIDALSADRAQEWTRVGAANFLTMDEKREAVGYGARPVAAAVKNWEQRASADQARDGQGR